MFKVKVNAMWSKDYLASLAQVFCDVLGCSMDESMQHVRDLSMGKRIGLDVATVGRAHLLACDLLQFGCYIEIEQVAPLSDSAMVADLVDWFEDDLETFRVVTDSQGHVTRIYEEGGYAFLKLETQPVADFVGQELLRKGAKELSEMDWPEISGRLKQAVAENEVRRQEIRARRAAAKRSSNDGKALEEE